MECITVGRLRWISPPSPGVARAVGHPHVPETCHCRNHSDYHQHYSGYRQNYSGHHQNYSGHRQNHSGYHQNYSGHHQNHQNYYQVPIIMEGVLGLRGEEAVI